MARLLDPAEFAGWLAQQKKDGCGYLMGAVGQKTAALTEGNWLVQQYRSSTKQFEQAKKWLRTAPRVFDCQGMADCYLTENIGSKVNVYARNNYSNWCSVKGKGSIPKEYRVPGAAVFIHSADAGRITHVGFLLKPVSADEPDGDWYVIEARGLMYGVVRTKLMSRPWNRWGLMDKYFDYSKVMEKYHGGGKEAEYVLGSRTLKKGRIGEDVRLLQELLGRLGYNLAADGVFGDETFEAVKAFKASEGLTANGIYGSAAHAALMSAIEEGGDEVPGSGITVRIAAEGTWNVRSGPGTGHGIITIVRQGMEFEYVSSAENGWIQMGINGGAGWVSPKCAEVY